MKKFIFATLICFSFAMAALAQQQQKTHLRDLRLDVLGHYGFIVPHHKSMQHLTQSHFPGFEVTLSEQTHGKQLWEQLFKYPIKGIGLFYSPLGNNKALGQGIAVYPYLNFRLTKGKKVNLYFRIAFGLGYLTNRFDPETNYKNIAIGTHFNAFIQLKYEMRWNMTKRLGLSAGLAFSHFSNAAFKTPNLGINIPTLNIGVSYKLYKETPEFIKNEVPDCNKKWQYEVLGGFGVNELYGAGGRKYPYFCLTGYFLKPLSLKRQLGIGLDVFYSEAVVESLGREGVVLKSKLEAIKPGLSCAYVMNFSHLAFIAQFGVYLYTKDKSTGYFFDRLALQYTVKNHYLFQLGLKTHFAKAEVLELGVGYKF
ncbi:MAG TPA: acyloxyacyl hydrolase [Bacteroidales bacterium]|nr:acyloxyacyl hydrolase [Bacteroidales bacterium]